MAIKSRLRHKVQVNMTDEQMEEVKRLSDVQGVSYAEIVRQAFENGISEVRERITKST